MKENSEMEEAVNKGMERGGGGSRCSENMCPEIPSRLCLLPSQKQKVVPRFCVLVLPPQFTHSAPVPFVHMSLSLCRVNLRGTILRDCVLDKKKKRSQAGAEVFHFSASW